MSKKQRKIPEWIDQIFKWNEDALNLKKKEFKIKTHQEKKITSDN